MIRTLLIIAGAALVLCVVTLGGAAAIGGRDFVKQGGWTFHDGDGNTVRFEPDDGVRPASVTRTLAWTGDDRLILDLAADVEYVQGATPGIVVTGPKDQADRVRLDGDRLTMSDATGPHTETVVLGRHRNGRGVWVNSEDLRIVVTAPSVSRFEVRGSSDLSIRDYDQPTLILDVSGSGDVTGEGRTRTLGVDLAGSGDIDLSSLSTTDADIDLSGSGDIRIAPSGAVQANLSGSGDVDLTTRPTQVVSDISGSGDVNRN